MTRLRPTRIDDAQSICNLYREIGLGDLTAEELLSRWVQYPFFDQVQDLGMGWVLENEDGGIEGSFGSLPLLYEYGDQIIRACIGCEWGVLPRSRSQSMRLANSFLRQSGGDIHIIGSANPTASQIFEKLKLERIPTPDYDAPLLWATNFPQFAAAALKRRYGWGAKWSTFPLGAMLWAGDWIRGSGRGAKPKGIVEVDRFDERFDHFLGKLRIGPPRLRAVRTSAVLNWRFSLGLKRKDCCILTLDRGSEIAGYVVLMNRWNSDLGMSMFDIVDLQALEGDSLAIRDLLLAAIIQARHAGVGALKYLAGKGPNRIAALSLRPHTYRIPFWQMFFKASDSKLAAVLSGEQIWDFSPFDNY